MSEFGDISRMNLSELERKGRNPQEEMDLEIDRDNDDEPADIPEDQDTVNAMDAGSEIITDAESDSDDPEGGAMAVIDAVSDDSDSDLEEEEVEVVDTKEHMAAPVGKHYYVDADITAKEMRAFLFAHNYRSPLMLIAVLVGVVWPIYTVLQNQGSLFMAIFCASVFLILMPFSIWYRGGANVKQNPTYQNTFHYMIDEAGLHLELGERALDVEWNQVTRVLCLGSSTAVYTGKVNAFLIPTVAMDGQKDEINSFIKDHVRK